jgi:transketolase
MKTDSFTEMNVKVKSVKIRFLNMYKKANAGHIGSSLSCAEILTVAKFSWMKEEDKLILSKGHAAASLYSVLAEAGKISDEQIDSYYQNNTILPAHPPVNKLEDIPFATGSLGHGLPIASGFGLSNKLLKKADRKIFCVTSDGELNEGSTWEAALFINQHQLKNVIWIIDRNKLQGYGKTEEVIQMEPLDEKLKSFGFEVISVDGHDIEKLMELKSKFENPTQPIAIIANTKKGNGWKNMEEKLGCHYLPISTDDYDLMIADLKN